MDFVMVLNIRAGMKSLPLSPGVVGDTIDSCSVGHRVSPLLFTGNFSNGAPGGQVVMQNFEPYYIRRIARTCPDKEYWRTIRIIKIIMSD